MSGPGTAAGRAPRAGPGAGGAAGGRRHWVYMLRLRNGNLYTGTTADLTRRYRQHLAGKASRYTRSFPPVGIAGCWRLTGTRGAALRVELFVKSQPRRTKEHLLRHPEALAGLWAASGRDGGLAIEPQDPAGQEGGR